MSKPDCLIALGNNRYRCEKHGWEKTIRLLPVRCGGCSSGTLALNLGAIHMPHRRGNVAIPRTPAQIETLAAYCRDICLDYGEANAELGWKEQCLHGCTLVVRKREKKPLLATLWERGRCPANRWPDV